MIELDCSINLPAGLQNLWCFNNNFEYPFEPTLKNFNILKRMKTIYYTKKYGYKIEKYYLRCRMNKIKKELMMSYFHPRRLQRFLEELNGNLDDF